MLRLISKKVSYRKTIALIKRLLQAGIIDFKIFSEIKPDVGQGSILSLLLCNIYLHELGSFFLKFSFSVNCSRRKNPEYRKLQYRVFTCQDLTQKVVLIKEQKFLGSKNPMDSGFCKLFYVRYVDDFIVGAMGGHNESQTMKNQLEKFLKTKLKMNLSDHKTAIIHFKKSSIFFFRNHYLWYFKRKKNHAGSRIFTMANRSTS